MRYTNLHFTYSLTFVLESFALCDVHCAQLNSLT